MALRAGRGSRFRRVATSSAFLAVLVCAAAALLAATPALRHAHSDFLAGGQSGHGQAAAGDHLQSAYRLWLPGHEIEQGRYPWRDPYSFRPVAEPQLNPAVWPFGLPFWPLWRTLGVVVGWNVFVLLGLIAAGLLTYAWLRELGLGVGAALVGGLAFEVAPYRLEQAAAGHLLAPISALLPLSLWTFERARRGSRWWLVPSALAIASIPASGEVHLALGAVPFYLAYVLVRTRAPWPVVGAAVGAALAVAAGVLVWLLTIDGSIGEGGSLRQVGRFSADWLDFVVRHDRHGSESFVFLGWLTPLVAIAGLVILVRRRSYGFAGLLGAATLAPIVLALGTTTPIYEAVRFVIWPLRNLRVPERLMPIACLAIAALVAYAVDELLPKLQVVTGDRRVLWAASALAVVLLLADLRVTTFEATAADRGNEAYAALRGGPPGRVLEVPVFRPGIHYSGVYLYYGTQVPRERPQGYSTLAPVDADRLAKRLAAINCGDWTGQPHALLRRLGITSVVFHEGQFRDNPAAPDTAAFAWRALTRHGFRPQAEDGPVTLLARRGGGPAPPAPVDEPRPDTAVFCEGWRPNDGEGRVTSARHASLWAYNAGGADLRLFLRAEGKPADVRLTVDGRRGLDAHVTALSESRLPLGDEGWHLVTIDGPRVVRIVAYALS